MESEYAGILVPPGSLERLDEKIVRGLTYLHYGKVIGPEYHIRVYIVQDRAAETIGKLLHDRGKLFERGPGIAVYRAEWEQDEITALYKIVIWGRFTSFAVVLDDRLQQAETDTDDTLRSTGSNGD